MLPNSYVKVMTMHTSWLIVNQYFGFKSVELFCKVLCFDNCRSCFGWSIESNVTLIFNVPTAWLPGPRGGKGFCLPVRAGNQERDCACSGSGRLSSLCHDFYVFPLEHLISHYRSCQGEQAPCMGVEFFSRSRRVTTNIIYQVSCSSILSRNTVIVAGRYPGIQ